MLRSTKYLHNKANTFLTEGFRGLKKWVGVEGYKCGHLQNHQYRLTNQFTIELILSLGLTKGDSPIVGLHPLPCKSWYGSVSKLYILHTMFFLCVPLKNKRMSMKVCEKRPRKKPCTMLDKFTVTTVRNFDATFAFKWIN